MSPAKQNRDMSIQNVLKETITQLTQGNKGILAADESIRTMTKRLEAISVESTPEVRSNYRELLFTTPQLNKYISGAILFDETFWQKNKTGTSLPTLLHQQGILPGIKVDTGLTPLPFTEAETITQGLDGLAERLQHYYAHGARFAKWRAVFQISDRTPSTLAISTNAEMLALYAALCQQYQLVPIVEPEVLYSGKHSLGQGKAATESCLRAVMTALARHHVALEYIILKPNMVTAGDQCPLSASIEEVAQTTINTLRATIPPAVKSINFLSGGQTPEMATAHLKAINQLGDQPWRLNFSYGRALQEPVLNIWKGQLGNRARAQEILYQQAKLNAEAAYSGQ